MALTLVFDWPLPRITSIHVKVTVEIRWYNDATVTHEFYFV
jgi:hypothetical protein